MKYLKLKEIDFSEEDLKELRATIKHNNESGGRLFLDDGSEFDFVDLSDE